MSFSKMKVLSFAGGLALGSAGFAISVARENALSANATDFQPRSATITQIHQEGGKLFINLSNTDYEGVANQSANYAKTSEYNFAESIMVKAPDGDEVPLSAISSGVVDEANRYYYNLWGKTNAFCITLSDDWITSGISLVRIKSGTQFPSYKYTNEAGESLSYVVEKEVLFLGDSTTTADFHSAQETNLGVTEIGGVSDPAKAIDNDALSRFFLAFLNSDHLSSAPNTQFVAANFKYYSFANKIKIDGTPISCGKINSAYFNLWGRSGTFAIEYDGKKITQYSTILFEKGCQIPAAADYNDPNVLKYYTIANDIVFTRKSETGYPWIGALEVSNKAKIVDEEKRTEISVANTTVEGTTLWLATSGDDYGTNEAVSSDSSAYVNQTIASEKLVYYGFLDKIKINGVALNEYGTPTDAYINKWTRYGSFSISLSGLKDVVVNTIEVPAGTRLPALSNSSASGRADYITIEEDYIYKRTIEVRFDESLQLVKYGEKALPPAGEADKEKDGYHITFKGWAKKGDPSNEIVTDFTILDTVSYVAVYDRVAIKYSCTWNGEKVEYTVENREKVLNDIKASCHANTDEIVYSNNLPDELPLSNDGVYSESLSYFITFDSDGGSDVAKQLIKSGGNVIRPDDPVKEGSKFLGWYNGDSVYDFKSEVSSALTLKAKWEKKPEENTSESGDSQEPKDPTKSDNKAAIVATIVGGSSAVVIAAGTITAITVKRRKRK